MGNHPLDRRKVLLKLLALPVDGPGSQVQACVSDNHCGLVVRSGFLAVGYVRVTRLLGSFGVPWHSKRPTA